MLRHTGGSGRYEHRGAAACSSQTTANKNLIRDSNKRADELKSNFDWKPVEVDQSTDGDA